ncbi:MAG: hypothetical protein IPK08_19900 [Bacteroidetes bacterium]|nr:hypothetical protein [Bacteroidota bacterium]
MEHFIIQNSMIALNRNFDPISFWLWKIQIFKPTFLSRIFKNLIKIQNGVVIDHSSQDGKTVRDSETQELELGQEIDLSQQL